MRIFALLGIGCLAIAIFLLFTGEDGIERIGLSLFAYYFGMAGLFLLLIAGLISRPPYLWIAAVITGILYIAIMVYGFQGGDWNIVFVPGLIFILVGLLIKLLNVDAEKSK